ncbi:MAG TPA: cyclic nucleotide-binding domain-containing protein [Phycisphaerae bacterium]|nr:cyclic nucleotide-binding domain-containing protein [Phycisphaerae bacterium]HOJ75909.1 cyclic nucleotide-binding domain-containing protein [Phycisphaerae bacterium]HOM52315.1 cyclic nucleotide-binding domain-containing protein [Phycisphaerae bacterium]HON65659.1 cyclic nucleotide-binding domain-containing protein [Phycisphaerae bacterium]HOQ84639.1 cyclic nucleotide-binding domain-containing protein [Phycisphaerae bacterium]
MVSPELLRRFAIFSGADEPTLKQVAMLSEEKTARAGDVLFREGEDARYLHIVVEGEVDIQYVLGDGSHQTVDTVVAGDPLVWSSLVPPHQTHSMGVARTAVKLVAIDAARLRELMQANPALGYQVMSTLAGAIAHRLHGARLQIAAM